ncbi:MAG: hypothetical protein ICV73_02265 [Acetobacteraceae bacterium]|nr:hypothetical protein [Acetobacteraceae bacterium]
MTRIAPTGLPEAPRAAPLGAALLGSGRTAAVGTGVTERGGVAAATAVPNPALRMDAELGLVVLQFRDAQGELAASIPTRRELDAYRQAVRTGAPKPAT